MLKGRRGKRRGGGSRRDLLRTDDDISCVIKNREYVIAKAMFRDGHLSGESQRIGAALIVHFRIKSGEEGFGEFGEVFFFQAEDGIRDYKVTGVQTCALPIWEVSHS